MLLRSMCAAHKPSLGRRRSMQWAGHVVLVTLVGMVYTHPLPDVFSPLLTKMAAIALAQPGVEVSKGGDGEQGDTGPLHLYRYGLGWLLLGALQKAPKGDRTAEWALKLARQIAKEGSEEELELVQREGGKANAYDVELYGIVSKGKGAYEADEATRRFFLLDKS